jgi:hypothetical protein
MNYKPFLIGAIIYVVLAIVLGMLVAQLIPFATLIGALIAGIYVGRLAATPFKAAVDGIIACVLGGVIAGAVTFVSKGFILATTGLSFLDSIITLFGGLIAANSAGAVVGAFAWFIAAGIILGAIGGVIRKKIKK